MPLQINNLAPVAQNQNVQDANNVGGVTATNVPEVMQNAKPSTAATVGRIFAAIFSIGITEIVRFCQSGTPPPAQAVEQAAQPAAAPSADQSNNDLATDLLLNSPLAPEMQAAIREGILELRPQFGELVPADGRLFGTVQSSLVAYIKGEQAEVTPARLKELSSKCAQESLAVKVMGAHIQGVLTELDVKDTPFSVYPTAHPEAHFKERLIECQTPQEVQKLFTEFEGEIRAKVEKRQTLNSLEVEMFDNSYARLSEATGISAETLKAADVLSKLSEREHVLGHTLSLDPNAPTGEALRAKYTEIATPFMDNKIAIYNSIADLDISDTLKASWQNSALCSPSVNKQGMFEKVLTAAQNVDVSSLVRALNEPAGSISDEQLLGLFQSVGLKYEMILAEAYGNDFVAVQNDPFELKNVRSFGAMALFEANPELVDALRANPKRFDNINTLAENALDASGLRENAENVAMQSINVGSIFTTNAYAGFPPTVAQAKENLKANITNMQAIPLAYADAMRNAISDFRAKFGAGSLPAGDTLAELQNSPVGRNLKNELTKQIEKADHVLSPQELGAACKASLRNPISATVLNSMAQDAGLSQDTLLANTTLLVLNAHHADLTARIAGAESPEDIRAVFASYPETQDLLQLFSATDSQYTASMNDAIQRIAEGTGQPVETIKKELDTVHLHSPLVVLAAEYRNAAMPVVTEQEQELQTKRLAFLGLSAKAENNASVIATPADVQAKYSTKVDRFVTETIAIYNAIPALKGAGNTPISDRLKVALQQDALSGYASSLVVLNKSAEIAQRVDTKAAVEALKTGDKATVQKGLLELTAQLDKLSHDVFSKEDFAKFDPDALSSIDSLSRQILLDTTPKLLESLQANEAILTRIESEVTKQMSALGSKIFAAEGKASKAETAFTQLLNSKTALKEALQAKPELQTTLTSFADFAVLLHAENALQQLGSQEAYTQLRSVADSFTAMQNEREIHTSLSKDYGNASKLLGIIGESLGDE